MALVVETGTASATADSYASVADTDTYYADRGFTLWATLSTNEKEQALRRATEYMQQMYRGSWLGTRYTATQALDWPRINAPMADVYTADGYTTYYTETEIPREVKQACIALAIKAAAGDLAPDIGREVTREKVGVLETEYAKGSGQRVRYQSIDMMLASLRTAGNGLSVRVGRA